ncbi:MAG TPA: hypothetical protein VK206_05895 [Anaerolineales bacterium]|nr:hypothetical protein [Anaerolineales bacterium]
MNNVEHILGYVIALIIELVVFFNFVYFVSRKTEVEVSRRWKASALISVSFGLLVQLVSLAIIVLDWVIKKDIETFIVSLPQMLISLFAESIVIGAMVTMPVILIGIFMAYHHLWQTGDRFVEKYWRNPKIHYDENSKPPFLKF